MMDWIKISDRLPELDETVLWIREDCFLFVDDIDHDNDWENFKKIWEGDLMDAVTPITHWAKIEPPKE